MNYIQKIRNEITSLEPLFLELLDSVKIEYYDPNDDPSSGVIIISLTTHYWRDGQDQIKTKAIQRRLKERLVELKNHILFLCDGDTIQVQKEIKNVFRNLEEYIELKSNHNTPKTIGEGKANIHKWLLEIQNVLNHIQRSNQNTSLIVIPDTNALTQTADPTHYRESLKEHTFSFMITTPVLRELDRQKEDGRLSESYREKVKKAIKRIKGFRTQGDITKGIIVDKTITVFMDYKEPKLKNSFEWLDANNYDDQIIARSLELQKENPNSGIIIVSSDINLQNKAMGAKLNYCEVPGN